MRGAILSRFCPFHRRHKVFCAAGRCDIVDGTSFATVPHPSETAVHSVSLCRGPSQGFVRAPASSKIETEVLGVQRCSLQPDPRPNPRSNRSVGRRTRHVLHPVHDALCRPAPQEAGGGPAQGRQRHLRTPHEHGGDDPGQVQPEADEQHLGAVQPLRTPLLPEELRDCRLPSVRPRRRPGEVLWTVPLESVALSLLGVFGNGHPRMVTTGRRQTPGNYGQYTDGKSRRL
ncbi:hypothetical protein IscW_ISCW008474 [Ixodes scapularis]|uniref:Uncharacterized protein n=1 Tax=Ixodes scapularis TaxID=6945 RepID=B7PVV4_IXOSC|nr:hypothetical protein IscW_ISCW008474 [Ixodes scapularis]|eukprot:XP_002408699.1 hypothetical protein IscW_ISCW008474 [Ixodes scapularis]